MSMPNRHPAERSFCWLLTSEALTQLASFVYSLTLSWTVYGLSRSPGAMAAVLLSGFLPRIALTLLGGYTADRLPRRRVLLAATLLRAMLLLSLAALASEHLLAIWSLGCAGALMGLATAFFAPAQRSLLAQTVSADGRQRQNALWASMGQMMTVVGMAAGAVLLSFAGAAGTFALAAALFAAAGFSLLPLPYRSGQTADGGAQQQSREALGILRRHPFLPIGMAVAALFTVSGEAPNVVLVPWLVRVHLGAGPWALSLTWIAFSVGALLTTGLLSAMRPARRRGLLAFGMTALAGLSVSASAFARTTWELSLCQFCVGAFAMVHGVLWESLMQEHVPAGHFGKVSALEHTLGSSAYPLGLLLIGGLSGAVGGVAVMAWAGVVCACSALSALLVGPIRRLD